MTTRPAPSGTVRTRRRRSSPDTATPRGPGESTKPTSTGADGVLTSITRRADAVSDPVRDVGVAARHRDLRLCPGRQRRWSPPPPAPTAYSRRSPDKSSPFLGGVAAAGDVGVAARHRDIGGVARRVRRSRPRPDADGVVTSITRRPAQGPRRTRSRPPPRPARRAPGVSTKPTSTGADGVLDVDHPKTGAGRDVGVAVRRPRRPGRPRACRRSRPRPAPTGARRRSPEGPQSRSASVGVAARRPRQPLGGRPAVSTEPTSTGADGVLTSITRKAAASVQMCAT